jgi:hypothetical protein
LTTIHLSLNPRIFAFLDFCDTAVGPAKFDSTFRLTAPVDYRAIESSHPTPSISQGVIENLPPGYAEILFTMARVRKEAEASGDGDDIVVLEGPDNSYDQYSMYVELWFESATTIDIRTATVQVRRSHLRRLLADHIVQQIEDQLHCIEHDVARHPEKQRPFISLLLDLHSLVDKGFKTLTSPLADGEKPCSPHNVETDMQAMLSDCQSHTPSLAVNGVEAKDTNAQNQLMMRIGSMIRIGSMVQGIMEQFARRRENSKMIHQVMEQIEHIDYSNGNQRKLIMWLDDLRHQTDGQWLAKLEQRQLEAATAQPSAARPGLRL